MMLTIITAVAGISIVVLVWQTWQVFSEVPDEDRQFLDRPATGFRLVWPLIQAWVHYAGHHASDERLMAVSARLRRAGVEYSLSPEQFLASKWVAALLVSLVGAGSLHLYNDSLSGIGVLLGIGAFFYPDLWLREKTDRRRGDLLRTLPFYLDIVTLSVEAGTNLTGGMTQAVQKTSDSELRREFSRVLRDIRAGKTRADALRGMAERSGSQPVSNVVSSLIQAEKTGSSLGPLLRAQSDQLRSQRFQRAEKKALEAPVKLLGPLIIFIFPTTFLVLIFMIMSKAIINGVLTWPLLVWAWQWPGA